MARKQSKKKKAKRNFDDKGEFRWETHFVRGKQKRRKIRTVDGMDTEEFIRWNTTDIWLLLVGHYEILHEREMERMEMERNKPARERGGESDRERLF